MSISVSTFINTYIHICIPQSQGNSRDTMYVYIYIHICLCVCLYTFISILNKWSMGYVRNISWPLQRSCSMYSRMAVCLLAWLCNYVYVSECVYMYICIHARMYIYIYI